MLTVVRYITSFMGEIKVDSLWRHAQVLVEWIFCWQLTRRGSMGIPARVGGWNGFRSCSRLRVTRVFVPPRIHQIILTSRLKISYSLYKVLLSWDTLFLAIFSGCLLINRFMLLNLLNSSHSRLETTKDSTHLITSAMYFCAFYTTYYCSLAF